MAFGGGTSSNDGQLPIAEINITPLTDVMLVLLIIAMVIAPTLAFKGAPMNLPQVDKPQQFDEADNLVQIAADGSLYFNQEPITLEALGPAMDELVTAADRDTVTLIIAADPSVAYQQVLNLWNFATAHKVERIVLAGDVVDQHGRSLLTPADTRAAPAETPATDGDGA
ncbi:MAG: hypothetical protein GEEBNDBF_00194 [bacterium]|nr:hypothetical protein [bacterium]